MRASIRESAVPWLLMLIGAALAICSPACGAASSSEDSSPTAPAAAPSATGTAEYPWARAPGPIEGRWRPACRRLGGAEIEFSMEDEERAFGAISRLGPLEKYGYEQGEVIFRLTANKLGKWVGERKRRTVLGDEQWEAVHFIAHPDHLEAVVTGEDCYRRMDRK